MENLYINFTNLPIFFFTFCAQILIDICNWNKGRERVIENKN